MNIVIHSLIPKKILSKVMYFIARVKLSLVKNLLIKLFMMITKANLDDAEIKDYKKFDSLLSFFTRSLDSSARIIDSSSDSVACPVDGSVANVGDILDGQIFQIKGHTYSLEDLVGCDYASNYNAGQATTIYLAPYDYHRIHSPLDATLVRGKYISGELNSVSIKLLNKIAGLFAKNERVILEFEDSNKKRFLMVLVGAVNVGSIETVFHGEISPNNLSSINLDCYEQTVKKGDEIGRFNLGSTIVLITEENYLDWDLVDGQKTFMGEKIATLTESSAL